MKISKRQLKRIVKEERNKILKETRAGRHAARSRMMDDLSGGDELRELRKLYPDLDDYFNGGWDEDAGRWGGGAWVVMDETEGGWVDTDVSTKGELGKLRAWDSVNSRSQRNIKANRMAAAEMGWTNESKYLSKRDIKQIIREEKAKLAAKNRRLNESDRSEELINQMMNDWVAQNPDATPDQIMAQYYELSDQMRVERMRPPTRISRHFEDRDTDSILRKI